MVVRAFGIERSMNAPPSTQSPRRWGMATRDLLVCAGIGVVCGLVMLPAVYLQITVTATVPVLYTIFTGTFILGPVIAQALIRRPGAALVAALVAALATAPFSPRGILAVGPMALVGIVFEVAALTGRYRTWPKWRWFLASFLLSGFSIVTITIAFDLLSLQPLVSITTIIAIPVSYLLGTWLSLLIAAKLERTGIGFDARVDDPRLGYVTGEDEPTGGGAGASAGS